MPAVAERKLSKEEFHARYDGEKPYYEFWDGEAVRKPMPTWLHVQVQRILQILLVELGYRSGAELELRLDPNYGPIPDVVGLEAPPAGPYPTKPFEVVIEVLSPDDQFSRILRKCRLYEKWGIQQIVVIDPEERLVWRFESGALVETDVIASRGEKKIFAPVLWEQVDRSLS